MKHFAVIGNPIEHSFSPNLHNYVYKSLYIDAIYEKKKVFENDLPQIMGDLKTGALNGVNVTIPHKENVLDNLDEINPRAKIIGAVNVIHKNGDKLFGNNTDWFGFSMSLKKNGIEVKNKEVIVLGAGGTSKSIIYALMQTDVKKIVLLNRTLQKAKELQDDIVFPFSLDDSVQLIKNDSIIINTTSIGMQSEQCPIDLGLLHKNQTLIDIIYTPLETTMLRFGNSIGAKTLNGLDMFIYQALASMELWFGEDISKQVNFTQLKTYLENNIC
ncbi:MAG: shikimate dehydrogenase [Candidatus Marinimicrobia bacterium]|nr:shikimate dehydrogenase [Candidatus Neomarinimicrobiota bacterium]